MKTCPFCAEEIQDAAIVCKHCGRDLPQLPVEPEPTTEAPPTETEEQPAPGALPKSQKGWGILFLIIVIAAVGWASVSSYLSNREKAAREQAKADERAQAAAELEQSYNLATKNLEEGKIEEAYEQFQAIRKESRHFKDVNKLLEERPEFAEIREAEAARVAKFKEEETAKARAAAEIKRQQELAAKWSYQSTSDQMSGRTTRQASIKSENTVSFSWPYEGPQRGTLILRDHPQYGRDVIMRIEQGQILCQSYQDCTITVRFGDSRPTTWKAVGPSDGSSEVIFIRGYSTFLQRLRGTDTVRIQVPVYQQGNPVFQFAVAGFEYSRYQP